MADALVSGTSARKGVEVQVLYRAPSFLSLFCPLMRDDPDDPKILDIDSVWLHFDFARHSFDQRRLRFRRRLWSDERLKSSKERFKCLIVDGLF